MSNYDETECEMMSDDLEMYNTVYKEMIELVGIECALKIYGEYNGQQISFPARLYSSSYVKSKVIEEFDGSNLKELAKKYGYTDRWIRQILKKSK